MLRRLAAASAALVAFSTAGCAGSSASPAPGGPSPVGSSAPPGGAFPVTVTASNGPVTLAAAPRRIVSLSPTATESLYAIGAGSQVVAVDDQSTYPAQAPRTSLSGFKPNVEAVAARSPDLVVASDDTNNLVAGLTKLKVPVLVEPSAKTLDDAYRQVEQLGVATGHVADGAKVVASMRKDIDDVAAATPKHPGLTYYYELDNTLFSAASKTFIGALLGRLGLTSIADKAAGKAGPYPQLSAEYVVAADPDLILLADTKCCKQTAATVAARPNWSRLRAVRGGNVVGLDDDVASRWGPRVVDLLRTVAAKVATTTPATR